MRLLALSIVAFTLIFAYLLDGRPGHRVEGEGFLYGRAVEHIRVMGEDHHTTGSSGRDRVRDYLVSELENLGLEVEIQSKWVQSGRRLKIVTRLDNIIAVMRGSEGAQSVLLMSHYDAVPHSPGAADDGSGVGSILETLRNLSQGERPRHDVVVVFTDGEELGLLGAKLFVEEHPLAQEIDLAMNFEGRGASGPVIMFETTEDNAWVVQQFAEVVQKDGVANSIAYEIYKVMPNDTDFTVLRQLGIHGLNFAFIDHGAFYHTARDDADHLHPSTLQHMGNQMLALTQHFANTDIPKREAGNRFFFSLPGVGLLTQPDGAPIVLTLFALLLFLGIAYQGVENECYTAGDILRAGLVNFGLILSSVIPALLFWWVRAAFGFNAWGSVQPYHSSIMHLGILVLTLAWVFWAGRLISGRFNRLAMILAGFGWWLVFGFLMVYFAPGGARLFLYPPLCGLLCMFLLQRPSYREELAVDPVPVLALSALPGLVLFLPVLKMLYQAMPWLPNLPIPVIATALFGSLAGFLLLGVNLYLKHVILPIVLVLVSFGFLIKSLSDIRPSHEYPRQESLFLMADEAGSKWVTFQKAKPWNKAWVAETEAQPLENLLSERSLFNTAPANFEAKPESRVEVFWEEVEGEDGVGTPALRLKPPMHTRLMIVRLEKPLTDLSLQGADFEEEAERIWVVGVDQEGVLLQAPDLAALQWINVAYLGEPLGAEHLGEPVPDNIIPPPRFTGYLEHAVIYSARVPMPAQVTAAED